MEQFNVHDAKTRFSKILAHVQSGEEVLIAKNGVPVAKVVPIGRPARARRPFGTAKRSVRLMPGWERPLPEDLLRAFES